MKTSVVIGRIAKVAAVVVVTATITWQARSERQEVIPNYSSAMTQQAGMLTSSWPAYRKAQVKEFSRTMPNRFALSKAYYGTENALLEAVELDRRKAKGELGVNTPKS